MRKHLLLFSISILFLFTANSQVNTPIPDKLKLFIDCSNTFCDITFIRTEITLVDFMLDQTASDVHVLITEQGTGGGGSQYQLIFFGQNFFRQMTDTIRFNTDPNATDFEERDQLVKFLKLGLSPYVARTKRAGDVVIQMKSTATGSTDNKDTSAKTAKDPWNYWVFRTGVNGNVSGEESIKSFRFSGNFSASRVTEELKTVFNIRGGKNKTTYTLNNNGNPEKFTNDNNDYSFHHYLIKSLTGNWSFGYETGVSSDTYSNNKLRSSFRTGFEYAIFPYKEVNTKYFTVSYTVDVRRNNYYDTTLFDKTKETLFGHGLESNLRINQKWGTIGVGAEYHNYFHNWKYFNLGLNTEIDIRITGGLSFNIYSFAELTRDQLFLPKNNADPLEVLSRRRQLASGYYFYTQFGINYRFGSKVNNFVNPRFD